MLSQFLLTVMAYDMIRESTITIDDDDVDITLLLVIIHDIISARSCEIICNGMIATYES